MHDLQCSLSNVFLMTAYSFHWYHTAYRTLSKLLALASFAPAILMYWIYLMLPNALGLFVIFFWWLCQQMVLHQMPLTLPHFFSHVPPPAWWTPFSSKTLLNHHLSFKVPPPTLFLHTSLRRIGLSTQKSKSFYPQFLLSPSLFIIECVLFSSKAHPSFVLGIPFLSPSQELQGFCHAFSMNYSLWIIPTRI